MRAVVGPEVAPQVLGGVAVDESSQQGASGRERRPDANDYEASDDSCKHEQLDADGLGDEPDPHHEPAGPPGHLLQVYWAAFEGRGPGLTATLVGHNSHHLTATARSCTRVPTTTRVWSMRAANDSVATCRTASQAGKTTASTALRPSCADRVNLPSPCAVRPRSSAAVTSTRRDCAT